MPKKKKYVKGGNVKLEGHLKGPSHKKGGIPFKVEGENEIRYAEGDEFVVAANAVNAQTKPVLEFINENGTLPDDLDYNYPSNDAKIRGEKKWQK